MRGTKELARSRIQFQQWTAIHTVRIDVGPLQATRTLD